MRDILGRISRSVHSDTLVHAGNRNCGQIATGNLSRSGVEQLLINEAKHSNAVLKTAKAAPHERKGDRFIGSVFKNNASSEN